MELKPVFFQFGSQARVNSEGCISSSIQCKTFGQINYASYKNYERMLRCDSKRDKSQRKEEVKNV